MSKVFKKTVYVAVDGKEYNTESEAEQANNKIIKERNIKFVNYLNGYDGQELVKKYTLDSYGIWKIEGEDPNADFGGHHNPPFLGIVEGKLNDVIEYAVTLPNFWSWGAGGSIKKIDVVKVPKISTT